MLSKYQATFFYFHHHDCLSSLAYSIYLHVWRWAVITGKHLFPYRYFFLLFLLFPHSCNRLGIGVLSVLYIFHFVIWGFSFIS